MTFFRSFVAVLLFFNLLVIAKLATAEQSSSGKRPNIILIMADDIGVEGLGCYGGTSYKTPALDRMASRGMRFTHAYSQPLCTNTRIQLMTGVYNNRNWKYFGILDPQLKTIGHYMSDAGYETCIAGKWQLQSYDPPDYPGGALRRDTGMKVDKAGFDEYCLWHTGHTEIKGSRYANPVILQNGKFLDGTKGGYGPDVWVNYINGYLERKKDSKKPFFVYYPMALPHWPMVPTPDSDVWSDKSRRLEENIDYFKDMAEYMDKCVGRIIKKVDDLGLAEDTLIIYYSDNGTNVKVTSQTESGPVAGGKGEPTDAGTLVPLIARWTGKIKPGLCDDLVDSTDFLPTILDGAKRPLNENIKIDGRSFFAQLMGKPGAPRDWVFCHYDPRPGWDKDRFRLVRWARTKRYKLYDDGRLFDISQDKLELTPILSGDDSATTGKVRKELAAVLSQKLNSQ
jgi:arylsulfatase A-like enzyme